MAVPVNLGTGTLDVGVAQQLFEMSVPTALREIGYQPSTDGGKFLALVPPQGVRDTAPPLTIRMNWTLQLSK
jgi:hypothetical protein